MANGHGGRRLKAGRRKGIPNKVTGDVRACIHEAFNKAGGAAYLLQVAKDDPRTFCALLGKVLPTTVEGGDTPIKTVLQVLWGNTDGSSTLPS